MKWRETLTATLLPMRWRETLTATVLLGTFCFLWCYAACAPEIDELTYWTRHYEHKLAVNVVDVDFVERDVECLGDDDPCSCAVPMMDEEFRVIYSTDGMCGLGTTEKTIALKTLCRGRMWPDWGSVEECMEWYR